MPNFKPSDVNTARHFHSTFGKTEMERMIALIVVMNLKRGDQWQAIDVLEVADFAREQDPSFYQNVGIDPDGAKLDICEVHDFGWFSEDHWTKGTIFLNSTAFERIESKGWVRPRIDIDPTLTADVARSVAQMVHLLLPVKLKATSDTLRALWSLVQTTKLPADLLLKSGLDVADLDAWSKRIEGGA